MRSDNGSPLRQRADGVPLPPFRPPSGTGLEQLRRNVKALYEDAQSHIRLERDAAHHIVRLQAEVAHLQVWDLL